MTELEKRLPPLELSLVADLVNHRLAGFFAAEHDKWQDIDPRLAEGVEYLQAVSQHGGKRLRAAFCFWSWHGAHGGSEASQTHELASLVLEAAHSEEGEQILNVCAALELLHSFALIHDDVMDNSSMRRGRTTVHREQSERFVELGWRGEPRRFGESVAVLVGNLGHVYSDMLMASVPLGCRSLWNQLKAELNLGQYLDVRSAAAGDLDFETAKQVAWFKSALYTICRPMQLGLAVSGYSTPEMVLSVDRFSQPLGRAFQLRDDFLGLFGDASQLGKPIGDDIKESKPTEMLAFALKKADTKQLEILSGIGRSDLQQSDIAVIAEVIQATGAVSYIEQEIDGLVVSAEDVLDEMPFSLVAKQALLSLARYVASRNV